MHKIVLLKVGSVVLEEANQVINQRAGWPGAFK